jgi:predicted PurR-regulated permease PerM
VLAQILSYGGLLGNSLLISVAIFLLAFYWLMERERLLRYFLLLLPEAHRDGVRAMLPAIEEKLGAYVRGVALLCFSVGAMALVAYLLMGLPNALFLGLAAGLFEAVPLLGPSIGAIPAVLTALAVDPGKVWYVIGALAVIQLLENSWLAPKVMDRTVGVNPVLGLLAFAAFGALFGLVGGLLAIPLAALLQILFQRFVLDPAAAANHGGTPAGRDGISLLRYETRELVQDVRKQVRGKDSPIDGAEDEIEDELEAIATDLDSLLARVEPPGEEGV